jgi:hypothetical protein
MTGPRDWTPAPTPPNRGPDPCYGWTTGSQSRRAVWLLAIGLLVIPVLAGYLLHPVRLPWQHQPDGFIHHGQIIPDTQGQCLYTDSGLIAPCP